MSRDFDSYRPYSDRDGGYRGNSSGRGYRHDDDRGHGRRSNGDRDRRPYGDRERRNHDDRRRFDDFDERDGWHGSRDDRDYEDRRGGLGKRNYEKPQLPSLEKTYRCPVAHRCGACEWLSMPYGLQLERKMDTIEELFGSYRCGIEPIIGMSDPTHYRNKVQLPFAPGRAPEGQKPSIRWGIFERGTHHIVGCEKCLVEDKRARPIISYLAQVMPLYGIEPYNERTDSGVVRYALVRTSLHSNDVMLTIVSNEKRLPSEKRVVERIVEQFPNIKSIVLNVNTERTNTILGKDERVLYGPGYIEDVICGCTFRISSSSFYQTNPIQAEKLYDLAFEMADLRPSHRFADAYCGTGTIGIVAAKESGAELLGIEKNPDAVRDARINARMNGLTNAEFIVGDAGSVFSRMARSGASLDVVFMDPPRVGSSQAFLANLSRLSPFRVVYISCNPQSQRHDLGQLCRNGYQVKRIRPVDMFPHTDHVENVILLERDGRR